MSIARRSELVKYLAISAAAVACACGTISYGQDQTAAPATDLARPASERDPKRSMAFVFEDAPVGVILTAMSEHLGFVTINSALPTTRVTIKMRREVDADEAVRILNEILTPLGYVAVVTYTAVDVDVGAAGSTILRVVPAAPGTKQVAVYRGGDPATIPLSDELRTQVIPVNQISAVGMLGDLRPLTGPPMDITASPGSNSIIVTDTAARIHRLAEIISALDEAKPSSNVLQYRQLFNGNAAEAAALVNSIFSQLNNPTPPQARGGGPAGAATTGGPRRGPAAAGAAGGGGTSLVGRVYADSDARTNTVVLSGPDTQVQMALDMLNRLEAQPTEQFQTSVLFLKELRFSDSAELTQALNQMFGNAATGASTGTQRRTLTRTSGNTLGAGGGNLGSTGTNRGTTGRFGN